MTRIVTHKTRQPLGDCTPSRAWWARQGGRVRSARVEAKREERERHVDGAPTARRGRADARAPGASPRTGGRAAVRRGRHGWRRAPTACRGRPLTSWARPSARSCAPGRPYGSADARWARAGAKRGRSARGEVGLGFRHTLRASMLAADFAPRLRLDTIGCRSERPTSDAAAVAGGVQRSTCHPVAWALSSEEDAAGDSAVAAHPFERDSVPRGDVLEGCRLHLLSKWRRYAVRQTDAAPLGRVKVEDARRRRGRVHLCTRP